MNILLDDNKNKELEDELKSDSEQEFEKLKEEIKSKIKLNKEIQELEQEKEKYEKYLENLSLIKVRYIVIIIFICLIVILISYFFNYKELMKIFILITLVVLSTYLFVSYMKLIFRFLLSLYKGRIKSYQIDEEKIKINKKDEFFNRLVEINFKYLDQYYFQTKEQADKSFFLVITSGIIGLGIIIVGIVLVYKGEQEPGNIAATAGILIEFITAIFFYIYNKTILKTGEYHKKLVLSQNISLALKTTEDFQGKEKFELREKIISEITKDINKYLCS